MDYIDAALPVLNVSLSPHFFICLNPLFVAVLSPIYMKILSFLKKKNKEPSSIDKLSIGLVMVILGFIFILIPSYISNEKISVIWLVFFNIFLVSGELFIMPISYSLTSKLAPMVHASLIMGALIAASSVGEILAGVFASAYPTPNKTTYLLGFIPIANLSSFIWSFIIFSSIILIIWLLLRNKMKKLSHGID